MCCTSHKVAASGGIKRGVRYRYYVSSAVVQGNNSEAGSVRRVPDEVRSQIIEMALDRPELSPRELAVTFTDERSYFVSEASVYRLLKARDLITSPAFIVLKAADEFKDKTTVPNQLWQTDFTYLKVTGWGWFYLSTILDDYSRYIVAWKLCSTMKADDPGQDRAMAPDAQEPHSAGALLSARRPRSANRRVRRPL